MTETKPGFSQSIVIIALLNAFPLWGVAYLGWKTFDLIFLYWLENVIIGVFTLLRFVVRPYHHILEIFIPCFMAPFFLVHYGMFCSGHGLFIFSMFGDEKQIGGLFSVYELALVKLQNPFLGLAAASLVMLQGYYWLSDIYRKGLGVENVARLMASPYRRIVILHITILASGFALEAIKEPVIGLVMLIIIKTIMDIHFWRKDSEETEDDNVPDFLDEKTLAEMEEKFGEPKVTVNGEDVYYDSFRELKASNHYRMMKSVLGLFGKGKESRLIDAYIDKKIAEEEQ